MNKNDAAAFLEVSIRTLENYVSANRLSVRYVKGKTRPVADFDPDELARFKETMGAPMPRVVEGTAQASATPNNYATSQDSAGSQNSANPNNPASSQNAATPQASTARNRETPNRATSQNTTLARLGDVAGNNFNQPIIQIQPEHLQALLSAAVGQGSTMQELSVKPLLTFPEAAQLTGLSERSLRVAAKEGGLHVKRMGRADRILRSALDKWLKSQFDGKEK